MATAAKQVSCAAMTPDAAKLLDHIAELERKLKAEQAARVASEERAAIAESRASGLEAEVETLRLTIAKLRRDKFGASSERGARLIDQLELQLAELEERIAQDQAAAEMAAPPRTEQNATSGRETRRKPARRPLPEHLSRERIVHPAPSACPCCGGPLRRLGEDITETLEHVPAQWKVIQHVREKFSCRRCEAITQPPAPSHPIARGRAGPQLLAQVLFGKYGAHLPLNRQSEIYAREGVELDVSTLADWVGACAATLMPLVEAIASHVFVAERIHADDTTVPVLAKGKTRTGRLWAYVRDDAPFAGRAPPAAVYYYSPDRTGEHPERHLAGYSGLMQADAYAGFNGLYVACRKPGPIIEAACWAHGRRKFYELAELRKAPLAIEAVRRIDELFAIERQINDLSPDQRLAVRRQRSKPLVDELEAWMRQERRKLSSGNPLAKAMNYSLERWEALTRFLDDGRVCLSNNAAERALRGIAVGRRNWTFAGSDSGGRRAAAIYTLIETAKLNDVDPRAWLADVLARIADHPASRIAQLLPWNWKAAKLQTQATAA
jgi:transposase